MRVRNLFLVVIEAWRGKMTSPCFYHNQKMIPNSHLIYSQRSICGLSKHTHTHTILFFCQEICVCVYCLGMSFSFRRNTVWESPAKVLPSDEVDNYWQQ